MNRADRLRVLLDVYGPASYGPDPSASAACLSPEDRRTFAACDEADRLLLNACLDAEAGVLAAEYAALERLAALVPSGVPRRWLRELAPDELVRALSALYDLQWLTSPEVERVS